ncbi:hypothetical protein FGB62_13g042 [Gracilaria domingensis]|nr:hypothetical protein FGB62_13g042 [Gracilaria domingensis]
MLAAPLAWIQLCEAAQEGPSVMLFLLRGIFWEVGGDGVDEGPAGVANILLGRRPLLAGTAGGGGASGGGGRIRHVEGSRGAKAKQMRRGVARTREGEVNAQSYKD